MQAVQFQAATVLSIYGSAQAVLIILVSEVNGTW
jgi:hypothetical protein